MTMATMASSAPFLSTAHLQSTSSAPKVMLSSRYNIFKLDAGLVSIAGAREVISLFKKKRKVQSLILGHNDLGDEGCKELFGFLGSKDGKKYEIQEISLNANHITDRGLEAIANYLDGNQHLKQLFLQNNDFRGAPETVHRFVQALNRSRLETLSFVTNCQLGDAFLERFLADLQSPYLRELQLSALGLSAQCTPSLVDFLSSERSRGLEVLKCNGNYLGLRSVQKILKTIKKANFSLMKLEVYSNSLQETHSSSTSDEEGLSGVLRWEAVEKELKRCLLRNEILRTKTQNEAVILLRHSRVLLLRSEKPVPSPPASAGQLEEPSSSMSQNRRQLSFRSLPMELQYYILGFLAPTLSSTQLVRIYNYASSPRTLPRPCLPHACIPDPSSLPFGAVKPRGCGEGRCLGLGNSLLCSRMEDRNKYLLDVECMYFELDDEGRNRRALEN